MNDESSSSPDSIGAREQALPELAELCRIHDIGIELIERSHDLDELLDRVLEEYDRRLQEIPGTAFTSGAGSDQSMRKLRALVMFARQAAALKEKAVAATALRHHAEALEQLNEELQETVAREELARGRVDEILEVLDAGVLVVGANGRVVHANRAASELVGLPGRSLVGRPAEPLLGDVARGADGEVRIESPALERPRVVVVARREMRSEPGAEVVLLSDVTERDRRRAEEHRMQRMRELLRTLGVLSHKINNPLTSLLGRAQILQMNRGLDPRVAKAADVIEESGRRIAAHIQELAQVVRDGREDALEKLLDMHPLTPTERGQEP